MRDPTRLLEGSASPLTIELLEAGRYEDPAPDVAEHAFAAALLAINTGALETSAAASALPSKSAAAAAAKLSGAPSAGGALTGLSKGVVLTPALVKWIGAGVIGLAAAGGAPRMLRWVAPTPHAREARPAAAPARAAQPARGTVRETLAQPARETLAHQATIPAVSARQISPSEAATAVPRAAAPDVAARQTSPSAAAPRAPLTTAAASRVQKSALPAARTPELVGLRTEISNIDRARERLQSGNAPAALRELARYEIDFPERQLQLEVLMLRMDAYAQSGQRERARELAEQVLSAHPSPAHAARARAVLSSAAAEP